MTPNIWQVLVMAFMLAGHVKLVIDDLRPVVVDGMHMRPRRGWVR